MIDHESVCDKCGRETGKWICDICLKNEAFGTISYNFHYGSRHDTLDFPSWKHVCDDCFDKCFKKLLKPDEGRE
jgi:hypothetical protein